MTVAVVFVVVVNMASICGVTIIARREIGALCYGLFATLFAFCIELLQSAVNVCSQLTACLKNFTMPFCWLCCMYCTH